MSQAAARRATYQDVLAAPENHVAEVIDGELHVHPRPAGPHTRSVSALGARLHIDFDAGGAGSDGGGWIILYEPELHLGADILVPDLAGWRVPRFPAGYFERDAFLIVAPDWVAEIASPATRRTDRMKKVPIYARERVRHVWLIEPVDRTIEVFRLLTTTYELTGTWGGDDEGPFVLEPFDAVPLPATAFWGKPLPPRTPVEGEGG